MRKISRVGRVATLLAMVGLMIALFAGVAAAALVTGTSGDDTLFGTDGNDTIRPGEGADTVYAGDGDDIIYAKDTPGYYDASGNYVPGSHDYIDCGAGYDQVTTIHKDDRTLPNCEYTKRRLGLP